MATKIAIHGAAGRMGQRLIALGVADPNVEIVGALDSPTHPSTGVDAGIVAGVGEIGILVGSEMPKQVDAVIDFSVPQAAVAIGKACLQHEVPVVLANTGLTEQEQEQLDNVAESIAICQAPNMSLAVNLLMKLSQITGNALAAHPTGADVEILERHHRFKEDAPSGTALAFGEIISQSMGQSRHQHGREGRPGQRPHGEIGYHAIRTGDNPGEHTIVFGLLGETIELRVAATSRDCYAQGALVAAQWLVGRSPGKYDIRDVLGL